MVEVDGIHKNKKNAELKKFNINCANGLANARSLEYYVFWIRRVNSAWVQRQDSNS